MPTTLLLACRRAGDKLKGRADEDDEPPFYCPVAQIALNGRYPFVLIKPTGHVVSQRALKQVGGKTCPVTEVRVAARERQPCRQASPNLALTRMLVQAAISASDALPINPSDDERKEMKAQLEARRAAQAEAKKQKKDKAAAGGSDVAVEGGGGGAAVAPAKPGKAKASAAVPPPARGSGGVPGAPAASAASASVAGGAQKRPRNEWEAAVEKRAEASDVYKSLFISAEVTKRG